MSKLIKLSLVALFCMLSLTAYHWLFNVQKPEFRVVELSCTDLTLGCGDTTLKVRTDRVPQVMRPFHLTVADTNTKSGIIDSVYVDFAMAGMSMGLNRYRLIQQADGHWQGDIILPVCVQGRSDWLMEVTVTTAKETRRYHLLFQATK